MPTRLQDYTNANLNQYIMSLLKQYTNLAYVSEPVRVHATASRPRLSTNHQNLLSSVDTAARIMPVGIAQAIQAHSHSKPSGTTTTLQFTA